MKTNEELFMQKAFKQSQRAFSQGEIPVGAVIVVGGKIVASAYNKREKNQNATAHAEILAIQKACKKLGSWRLLDACMYVTLMPCPMCAGAIVNARIKKVFYGAENENKLLFEQIMQKSDLNHKTEFEGGILEQEAKQLLQKFFKNKRNGIPINELTKNKI